MTATIPIPRRPTDLTAEWLAAALATRGHRVGIRDVDVAPVGTGQTAATCRITPAYSANPSGLPNSFIVKLPAQDDALRARLVLGYRSEVGFYDRVARHMTVPTPRCFYRDITADGADFVLMLADQAPAAQGDQIRGCTAAQARVAVAALAGLHGPSWCDPVWLDLTEVAMPKPGDRAAAEGLGAICRMATAKVLDDLGSRLPPDDRAVFADAMDAVDTWLIHAPVRYSLMHGDYRLDNLLFHPDDSRVTVVDWQTVGIGLPARDLSYFIATGLTPDARAAYQRALVEDYRNALARQGIADYDHDTCWHDYRFGMIQATLTPALGHMFATPSERGNEMVVAMLLRACRALRELDTLALVDKARQ
jgi:aminoglycoside phosphotransferase (APT) family kinase protein